MPLFLSAQKIVLGSCTTHDGGQYKGQMMNGKPNGKGHTVFKNGDTYEGEYIKGKREAKCLVKGVTFGCSDNITRIK